MPCWKKHAIVSAAITNNRKGIWIEMQKAGNCSAIYATEKDKRESLLKEPGEALEQYSKKHNRKNYLTCVLSLFTVSTE